MEMRAVQVLEERTPLVADINKSAAEPVLDSITPAEQELFNLTTSETSTSTTSTDGRGQAADEDIQLSWTGVYVHMLKGIVGLGILGLPYAFSLSGLLGGCVLLPVMTVLITHCMHLLANSSDHLSIRYGRSCPGYGEVGELAIQSLPGNFAKYKDHTRITINFFIFLLQYGICAGAQLFFGKNLHQVLAACGVDIHYRFIIFASLPMFILGSFICELKTLVVFSAAAILFQLISYTLIVLYLVGHLHWEKVKQIPSSVVDLGMVFGLFLFPLEGINLVIPLKNRSAKVTHFNTAVSFAMFTAFFLFLLVGCLGYVSFPNHPRGSITLSLPATGEAKNIPNLIVKLYYPAAMIFHFCLQLYPITRGLDDHLSSKYKRYRESKFSSRLLRSLVVLSIFVVAVGVPSLASLMALFGSVAGAAVSLIFPPLIDLAAFWSASVPRWVIVKDSVIAVIGFLGMVFGLAASIDSF